MKNIDEKLLVPDQVSEAFGHVMRIWGRVEYNLGVIVQYFPCDEKILAKLNDPKKNDPDTYNIIEELKNHARKKYEQFILERKNLLEDLEKTTMQDPGEYTGKNFDAFIEDLHIARKKRNDLVHEIGKKEFQVFNDMYSNYFKTGALPENFNEMLVAITPGHLHKNLKEMLVASSSENDNQMVDFVCEHGEIMCNVAMPVVMFRSWLQDTNRIPPPKL